MFTLLKLSEKAKDKLLDNSSAMQPPNSKTQPPFENLQPPVSYQSIITLPIQE